MKENLFPQGIITKDMMDYFFSSPSVSVMASHINSEPISIFILGISFCVGAFGIYKTVKNLRILKKHHDQSKRTEFDTESNTVARSVQMNAMLLGKKRVPFRKWITEPPSITTLTQIKLKRKYKAIINFFLFFLSLFLVMAPFQQFTAPTPYEMNIYNSHITFKSILDKNVVIDKDNIAMIKYEADLEKDGTEYFYPRCKVTFVTPSGDVVFSVKNYNMEVIKLKKCS